MRILAISSASAVLPDAFEPGPAPFRSSQSPLSSFPRPSSRLPAFIWMPKLSGLRAEGLREVRQRTGLVPRLRQRHGERAVRLRKSGVRFRAPPGYSLMASASRPCCWSTAARPAWAFRVTAGFDPQSVPKAVHRRLRLIELGQRLPEIAKRLGRLRFQSRPPFRNGAAPRPIGRPRRARVPVRLWASK